MNIKRMEVMIDDLSENFERHVSSSIETYNYVLQTDNGQAQLELKLYSQGGNIEMETLLLSDGASGSLSKLTRTITVDGKTHDTQAGAITMSDITLARGRHTIKINVGGGVAFGRVRIAGSISGVTAEYTNN